VRCVHRDFGRSMAHWRHYEGLPFCYWIVPSRL
jgi:hypothetical protein